MEDIYMPYALQGVDRFGRLLTKKSRVWLVGLLAFFVPMLIMQLFWAFSGVQPFGSRMILAHDQWHQYYPFFVNFRERLREGHSLLYSWETGMGTNYLSLVGYYLASPLNLPALFLPDSMVLGYYTLTVLLKIGFAGLFFWLFLRFRFERCELSQVFFSTMYALCAFIMGYYWNAIWLDTVALLPLVVLGTYRLLRDRRYILYTVSLALAVMCSYYIGLFVCYFVLLLFICYNVVNWDDFAGFRSRLWRIALFSVLALAISAVVTGPALIGLLRTSSADNSFPQGFSVNIAKDASLLGVLDALRQIVARSAALTVPTSMEGLPNIYCGVIVVLLSMVYFFCRQIPWKEKLCAGLLLLFFALSFIIRQLDYVWHGFHFPNMLPYRFSFLFSFVLLYMAYRAYTELDRFRVHYLLLLLPMLGVFLYCVFSSNKFPSILATVVLLAIGVCALALYGLRRISRNILALILCVCLLAEAGMSGLLGVREVSTTDAAVYPRDAVATQTLVDEMKAREEGNSALWRAEFALKQTLNDSTFFSMSGVSVFSSTCNSGVSNFLQSLGFAANVRSNRYIYDQSDPAIHLLLSLKYLIDREGLYTDKTHFTQVAEEDGVLLLENNDYLPVGWAVNVQALGYDPESDGSCFTHIEDLYARLTGTQRQLYTAFPVKELQYSEGASGPASDSLPITFRAEKEGASVTARVVCPEDGSVSILSYSKNAKKVDVYINGSFLCSYDDKYHQIRYYENMHAGDEITLEYTANKTNQDVKVGVFPANFDEAAYREIYSKLSEQVFRIEERSDTELVGTIQAQQDSLFFATIPYDSGWTAEVDGEEVRITPVADAFVAFRISAGTHEIRLSYETPGLRVCAVISICALALLLVLIVLYLVLRLTRRPIAKIALAMEGMDEAPEPSDGLPAAEAELSSAPYYETEQDYDYVPEREFYEPGNPSDTPAPSLPPEPRPAVPAEAIDFDRMFDDPGEGE